MSAKPKLWSVSRIKHPKHPRFTVRVTEFQVGGKLHFSYFEDGEQRYRALDCRRVDLGTGTTAQVREAKRLACELIEGLAARSLGEREVERTPLTFDQLHARYKVGGLLLRTAAYRRDSVNALARLSAFFGQPPHRLTKVEDLRPSHLEAYVKLRRDEKHLPAGKRDLQALSMACGWAEGERLLARNPFNDKRVRNAMRVYPPEAGTPRAVPGGVSRSPRGR